MKNVIDFKKEYPYIGSLCGKITLPSDYKEGERLPLILFLHGAGEVGDGTFDTLEKVRVHGIPKYFTANPDYNGIRAITASPQCIDGYIWDQLTLFLKDWVDTVAEKYNADKSRISVTGISMGGFGTWNMITTYPDYFYRAAPVCGGGVSWRINEGMKNLELRVFHSTDDGSVPYECSVLMVQRAVQAGIKTLFTSYTDKGHGCWSSAYEESDLISWLAGEDLK